MPIFATISSANCSFFLLFLVPRAHKFASISSAKLYENLRNMGAMFAFSNLSVPPPRAMSHMDVSQGDHKGSIGGGGSAGLKAAGADQRPSFHRSDMFLERSPTLATVGSSGSAVSSRAGTIGGGVGGSSRKQMLGQARSELRIIENHQHDNYATVSGGSLGHGSDSSARADVTGTPGTTLLQLQDLARCSSQRSSQRPSLQSMFSAQGSLLQLEPQTGGGSLQSDGGSGGGGCSMQNLKQTAGSGSFDDPSPYSTLKKRKVSQPSPLPPPPPSKLVFNASPKQQQHPPTATDTPTTDPTMQRVGGGVGQQQQQHPLLGDFSYAAGGSGSSPPLTTTTAVLDPMRTTVVSGDPATSATAIAGHRSNRATIAFFCRLSLLRLRLRSSRGGGRAR